MNASELSGVELIRMIADGRIPNPGMADTMHMKITKVDHGAVEFQAEAGKEHFNPMDGVHGGFAATLLDSATGAAVHTLLAPGERYGTIDLSVKMLKPVPPGKIMTAAGRVIHMSKRLGVSEASLQDDAGRLYAHATATCMILRHESDGRSPS